MLFQLLFITNYIRVLETYSTASGCSRFLCLRISMLKHCFPAIRILQLAGVPVFVFICQVQYDKWSVEMFSEAVVSLCREKQGKTVTVIEGSSARNVLVCGFILLEVLLFFVWERLSSKYSADRRFLPVWVQYYG